MFQSSRQPPLLHLAKCDELTFRAQLLNIICTVLNVTEMKQVAVD